MRWDTNVRLQTGRRPVTRRHDAIQEGERTALDNTMLLFCSSMLRELETRVADLIDAVRDLDDLMEPQSPLKSK
jgi:hypothetical protein